MNVLDLVPGNREKRSIKGSFSKFECITYVCIFLMDPIVRTMKKNLVDSQKSATWEAFFEKS